MGTHAAIGIQTDSELASITSIYCHYDGYLDHVGKTLLNHYSTAERVRELIALGDISSLGERIGEKHDFNSRQSNFGDYGRQAGYCLAYHRDRNDLWDSVCPITSESIQDFLEAYDVGYYYIFVEKESCWYVKTSVEFDPVFRPLAGVIDCYNEDLTN